MKQTVILMVFGLTLMLFSACKKEKFPDIDGLQGVWTEQTDNSVKHTLIFEEETMYFVQPNYVDTLLYQLDKKKGLMYLRLKNNPSAGSSNLEIVINKKNKTLTIWGLFPTIPEQKSETTFKK